MSTYTFRAPGKLVLIGEYGVLDGAGAIVAAVNHGVTCRHTPGPLAWVTPGDDTFVRAALAGLPDDAGQFAFGDWNPVDLSASGPPAGGASGVPAGQRAKPGFGGSAAATVAAVLASGKEPLSAFDIHKAVQGGGSGVDVFASLNGGVRRFPDGGLVPPPHFAAVWSGRSAATGPRVRQYQAWKGRRSFVQDSHALVEGFALSPVAATKEAWHLLRGMTRAAGIDYETPEHAHIVALAERFGGAAKPSGAGGGDIAVAVFPEPASRAAFCGFAASSGLTVIPCEIAEPAGLWAMHGSLVDLLPFTPERLALALQDREGLARSIEAKVPGSWPQPDYAAVMKVLAQRWARDPGEAWWAWLVTERATRTLIGEIGGKIGPNRRGELEFGYAIVPECRGRGLARDAAAVFVEWARGESDVKHLLAECLEGNEASKRVLQGVGLREVGGVVEGGQRVLRWRG